LKGEKRHGFDLSVTERLFSFGFVCCSRENTRRNCVDFFDFAVTSSKLWRVKFL